MGDQPLTSTSDAPAEDHNPTGHAILRALRELGALTHSARFPGHELYTTVAPCPMCAAACVMVQLDKIYYGLDINELDMPRFPDSLDIESFYTQFENPPALHGGLLGDECRKLL
jgi:tRNA(Arg) A34 adenosine deaminase TadA